MCLSADETNPLCDDCFAELKENPDEFTDDKMCDPCKEMMTRYCHCCMTLFQIQEEGDLIDGICKTCR